MLPSSLISESPSRTERKRARNREALIAAARRLFAAGGFDATTIADISEAADLGFGTFYRYFDDKEAVLEAVLDEGRREIDAVLECDDGGDAGAALRELTARFVQAVRRNHDVLLLMWQISIRDRKQRRSTQPAAAFPEHPLPIRLGDAIARIIERGIASGEFASGDAHLLSRFVASAHMYLLSPGAQEIDEASLIETMCEFELRALGASPRGSSSNTRSSGRNSA